MLCQLCVYRKYKSTDHLCYALNNFIYGELTFSGRQRLISLMKCHFSYFQMKIINQFFFCYSYSFLLPNKVLTFLIDPSRFRYPERAIVFLAVCYLVVGCAYVAGLGAGDTAACREPFPPPIRLGKLPMYSTITQVS